MYSESYTIEAYRDHYIIRKNGKFVCSADSVAEARKEIPVIDKELKIQLKRS